MRLTRVGSLIQHILFLEHVRYEIWQHLRNNNNFFYRTVFVISPHRFCKVLIGEAIPSHSSKS